MQKMTTAEVAERLGVKPATVYAYVSRGLLRSERDLEGRKSVFDRAEVERIALKGRRGEPSSVPSLVVESSLTRIDEASWSYRGVDGASLVGKRSFEEVAEFLWTGAFAEPAPWQASDEMLRVATESQRALPEDCLPIDRIRVIVVAAATTDDLRFDTRLGSVIVAARSMMAAMVDGLPGPPTTSGKAPLAARLWGRLARSRAVNRYVHLLDAALVATADHELAASTFAARVAASVKADPYAVVSTGLGVLTGPLHGAASLGVESLLHEMDRPRDAPRVVGERLRRGDYIPGFGHAIYKHGDPRATVLLDIVRDTFSPTTLAMAEAVADTARQRGLPEPNIDFVLGALSHAARLRRGSGEAIFGVARSAGWIAHAMEEYERPTRFRPRALYVGPS